MRVNREFADPGSSRQPDCIGTIFKIWSLNDRDDNKYAMVMWSNGTKSSVSLTWLELVMET